MDGLDDFSEALRELLVSNSVQRYKLHLKATCSGAGEFGFPAFRKCVNLYVV